MRLLALALCVLLPFAATAGNPATSLPHVAIVGFSNLTGNEAFDVPGETATGNLDLTLRMLGSYRIVSANDFQQGISEAALTEWCEAQSVDYVLYGSITEGTNEGQRYALSVYDRAKGKTTIRKTAEGSSVFDVFSATDSLTLSVIDAITGRHVGFGSIAFAIQKIEGQFRIEIDSIPVATTFAPIPHVVEGNHVVKILRVAGDTESVLLNKEIEVTEGETVTLAVEIPRARAEAATATDVPLAGKEPLLVQAAFYTPSYACIYLKGSDILFPSNTPNAWWTYSSGINQKSLVYDGMKGKYKDFNVIRIKSNTRKSGEEITIYIDNVIVRDQNGTPILNLDFEIENPADAYVSQGKILPGNGTLVENNGRKCFVIHLKSEFKFGYNGIEVQWPLPRQNGKDPEWDFSNGGYSVSFDYYIATE